MKERIKLMIVDDSSIVRTSIKKYLDDFNVTIVGFADDGLVALDLFKKTKPTHVTLDITMPEMNGLQVLEEILKHDPSVNVLVVTALSDKETGLKALELGAKGIVVKPFTPEKLKDSFRKLLQAD